MAMYQIKVFGHWGEANESYGYIESEEEAKELCGKLNKHKNDSDVDFKYSKLEKFDINDTKEWVNIDDVHYI